MQNNDPRLFKAAKRTIRAEITLIVFVVLITSWSLYALYTLATGTTDSIFGFNLGKLFTTEKTTNGRANKTSTSTNDSAHDKSGQSYEATNPLPAYMSPQEIRERSNLLKGLIQRQLYQQRIAQLALQAPTAMAALQRLNLSSGLQSHGGGSQNLFDDHEKYSGENETYNGGPNENEPDQNNDREPSASVVQDSEVPVENSDKDQIPDENQNEDENHDEDGQEQQSRDNEDNEGDSQTEDELSELTTDSAPEEDDSRNNEEPQIMKRDGGKTFDEGMDRMTQPSSGVASREDQPFDYKGVVRFDDALHSQSNQQNPKYNSKQSIGIIPRFVDPANESRSDKQAKLKSVVKRIDKKFHSTKELDGKSAKNESRAGHTTNRAARVKRSLENSYINGNSNMLVSDMSPPANITANFLQDYPDNRELNFKKMTTRRKNQFIPQYKRNSTPIRRSEDEENEEDGDEDDAENSRRDARSRYQYLTTNDASLQELLAQQKLLDALSQSQLPAPSISSLTTDNSTHDKTTSGTNQKESSDSLYSLDPAILLTPAFDEKHNHKSMRKKKMEKSKAKKKMTVAMKKGGHKKKKHKKEEKKYLKEKKFKGAKKGKKSSKGKGGQGGKKGKKFYKDKGFKKKGFKNVYHKEEFGQKKSYFDEFRDKNFKKKWKKFDDKYNYAKMKKWQAKDVKGAKKMKDQGEKFKKYDKSKWKKKYAKEQHEKKKKKSSDEFD